MTREKLTAKEVAIAAKKLREDGGRRVGRRLLQAGWALFILGVLIVLGLSFRDFLHRNLTQFSIPLLTPVSAYPHWIRVLAGLVIMASPLWVLLSSGKDEGVLNYTLRRFLILLLGATAAILLGALSKPSFDVVSTAYISAGVGLGLEVCDRLRRRRDSGQIS